MLTATSFAPVQRQAYQLPDHEIIAHQHCSDVPNMGKVLARIMTVVLCIIGALLVIQWPPLIIPPLIVVGGIGLENVWNNAMAGP